MKIYDVFVKKETLRDFVRLCSTSWASHNLFGYSSLVYDFFYPNKKEDFSNLPWNYSDKVSLIIFW